ncbi:MAG: hypothetical protein IPP94_08900 [Ignavibacteria bacterium]|nr:hypothetical protein [Ignavibacteria bacterium]
MRTILLAFLTLSVSLSAQTLWDKAEYGASRTALLKAYPDAVRSDGSGAFDANGSDLTVKRNIGMYRYAVTMNMRNNKLSWVSVRPLAAPTQEMYTDMLYSIIAKYGGPSYSGDEAHRLSSWRIEQKQVLARAEFTMPKAAPWIGAMSVRYELAKDVPEDGGC